MCTHALPSAIPFVVTLLSTYPRCGSGKLRTCTARNIEVIDDGRDRLLLLRSDAVQPSSIRNATSHDASEAHGLEGEDAEDAMDARSDVARMSRTELVKLEDALNTVLERLIYPAARERGVSIKRHSTLHDLQDMLSVVQKERRSRQKQPSIQTFFTNSRKGKEAAEEPGETGDTPRNDEAGPAPPPAAVLDLSDYDTDDEVGGPVEM